MIRVLSSRTLSSRTLSSRTLSSNPLSSRTLFALACVVSVLGASASSAEDPPPRAGLDAAVILFESGELAEAEAALLAVLEGKPDEAGAHAYLGLIALDREETEVARSRLEEAVRLEGSSDHHLWLGRALLAELQSANFFAKSVLAPKVRRAFETAVELDPSNDQARVSLGNFYLNAPAIAGGSKAKAREQAAAIIPSDPRMGHELMAEILLAEGKSEEALAQLEKALALYPEDPELLYTLGMTCQGLQYWDRAFEAFERAMRAKSDWGAAVYQYGRTGALSGVNLERSAAALERFIAELAVAGSALHGGAWWRLGMIREHEGKRAAAAAAYRTSLELDPDQKEAREALRRLEALR